MTTLKGHWISDPCALQGYACPHMPHGSADDAPIKDLQNAGNHKSSAVADDVTFKRYLQEQ